MKFDPTIDLTPTIENLYMAAAEPTLWTQAWEGAVASLGATTGSIVFQAPGADKQLITMPGFSDHAIQLYFDHYHKVDVWADLLKRHPSLRVFLGQDLVSHEKFRKTEVWNDFSRPHLGSFHLVGAVIPINGHGIGYVGIHRPFDAPEFEERERETLARILPHVQRAIELHKRLERAIESSRIGFAALDLLSFGAAVVRANGDIVFANAAMDRILAARDGLISGRTGAGLIAMTAKDTKQLLALIHNAALGGAGGATRISRAVREPLIAHVSRLPGRFCETYRGPGAGLALLAVHDPETSVLDIGGLLSQAFGLTPAEIELVLGLLKGDRLQDISEQRGVRVTTARSQLRCILSKTGTARQSDLVRLVSRFTAIQPPE